MKEIDPQLFNKIVSSGISQKKNQPGRVTPGAENFQNILEKNIEKQGNTQASSSVGNLPEIETLLPAGRVGNLSESSPVTELLDASLDQLEQYTSLLEDPDKSLKETKPLLDLLIEQAASLHDRVAVDPELNPELAEIIARLQIIVQNEQLKFNRGDYL